MMKLLDAFADYIEKARSRVYGIFVFWVAVFCLPVIFTAFFVNQDIIYKKYGQLKGEYVMHTFFDFTHWWPALYTPIILIGSIIMTWLMIWVLPKLLVKKAYARELEDQSEREYMRIKNDEKLAKRQSSVIEKQKENIEAKEDIAEKENRLESQETQNWNADYNAFKKTNLYQEFQLILESVYEHYGNVAIKTNSGYVRFEIPTNLLSYADGAGLVEMDVPGGRIELTPKGRYFMMRYQEDTNKLDQHA